MARAFSQLDLVRLVLIPPIGTDTQSCPKQELVLLSSPGSGWDHVYQVTDNWWEKQALPSQTASFPWGSSPNFSLRVLGAGCLFQAVEFASATILAKMSIPSGF